MSNEKLPSSPVTPTRSPFAETVASATPLP
jgi:hypothetical protein